MLDPPPEGGLGGRRRADRQPLRVRPGPARQGSGRAPRRARRTPTSGSRTRRHAEKRLKYYHELRAVQAIERNPTALSYERERAAAKRKDLDADRRELIADLQAQGAALHEAVTKLATDRAARRRRAGCAADGPRSTGSTSLTTYGLIAMGLCLMLGLFTPLAALAGAVFLGQIYLSMPPWPGLPANPMAEGHYLYRQQEPDRDARLPGPGLHPDGPLGRARRSPVRLARPPRGQRRRADDSRRELPRTIEPTAPAQATQTPSSLS